MTKYLHKMERSKADIKLIAVICFTEIERKQNSIFQSTEIHLTTSCSYNILLIFFLFFYSHIHPILEKRYD